jgi:hypothetical protein
MPRLLRAGEQMPRFVVLLATMFLELLMAPLIAASPLGVSGARAVTSIILLAALLVVGANRFSLVIFGATFVSHVATIVSDNEFAHRVAPVLRFVFLLYVFARIMRHVLRDRNVTFDTIAGAACGYMLLGLIWGDLFIMVEQWSPGSYEVPSSFLVGPAGDNRAALIYFSFVTLTTVGYGIIHPNNPGAGGLAVSEAITGQLYLAVTISRLVGLHISNRP